MSSARRAAKVSETYLTKIRPRTRCLYSAASILARSLSAVAQRVFLMSSSMGLQAWGQTAFMPFTLIAKPVAYTESELQFRGKLAQRGESPLFDSHHRGRLS